MSTSLETGGLSAEGYSVEAFPASSSREERERNKGGERKKGETKWERERGSGRGEVGEGMWDLRFGIQAVWGLVPEMVIHPLQSWGGGE
jgi:hypothetical protein